MDETRLIEKVRAIEALFAGATTEGESVAADRAHDRIRERLKQWELLDRVIKRPELFSRSIEKDGIAPDEVTLSFTRPPGWDGLSDDEFDDLIEKRLLE